MPKKSILKVASSGMLISVLLSSTFVQAQSPTSAPQLIHWTQLGDAQLKLDSKPPLTWAVYQPDKKSKKKGSDLVLVLVGHRYMMLDLKAKLAYLVFPSDLHAQGKDFDSNDMANPSNVIPSSDWTVRDVGPAELVRLTLGDYGRVLDVSLSHPQDMTSFY
jgi:hypothetical protein